MTEWSQILLEPFAYPFMIRGLIAAIIVGTVCAVLGVYVVLRGMAFLGDAIAHAILPGVAVGYLIGGSNNQLWLSAGGLVAGILTSLGVGTLSNKGIKEDTAIGILFAGMFALGIALISTAQSYTVDLSHFLFGNVLGVSTTDLWLIGGIGLVVILNIVAFYKELQVISFDPLLAQTLGLPIAFLNNLLLVLIAATIILSLQTVGVALMTAMLVTPAATAHLLVKRLWQMMILAALIGAFSAISGLYLSFYVNIASGAAIVLVCTLFFFLVFGYSQLSNRKHLP